MAFRKPHKPAAPRPKQWPHWDPPTARNTDLPEPEEFKVLLRGPAWGEHFVQLIKVLGIALLVLGLMLLFALPFYLRSTAQDECRARGGRVLEVHGSRDMGWVCVED